MKPNAARKVLIVGGGAAGLAAAIFLKRINPGVDVDVLEGARRPGAKILISGGTRCNVTNRIVTDADFWGGTRPFIRSVLRKFSAQQTVTFFRELGVPLHEEGDGKLFPDSERARDVLHALLRGVDDAGARLLTNHRVLQVSRTANGFRLVTTGGTLDSAFVVLATGGQSLPKSGSDGLGFDFARGLGHTIVPTTPALAPLVLSDAAGGGLHQQLSGVSHDAEIAVWVSGRVTLRLRGSFLWTHFGISGPVVLNASRHWLRATLEGKAARLTMSLLPGQSFEHLDGRLRALASTRPKASVLTGVSQYVPTAVAEAMLATAAVDRAKTLSRLTREERRLVVASLLESPLPVVSSRGYNVAEATAGGIQVREVDAATMESRVCRGLYLIGEVLDVDGRIGGFNFQWAWSTAFVAAHGLSKAELDSRSRDSGTTLAL